MTYNHILKRIKYYSFEPRISFILLILLTLIGIIRGLQHYYIVDAYETIQFGLRWHIPFNVFLWWLWLLFVPLISYVVFHLSHKKYRFLYWIVTCILMPFLVVAIRQTIASFIISEVLRGYKDFLTLLQIRLLGNVWIWLDYGMYFTLFFSIQLLHYYKRLQVKENLVVELQQQLAKSKLRAIESQLRPHFLFNTFNTLSTFLLKKDKTNAQSMVKNIRAYLASTLNHDNRAEITLEEELQYIYDYLKIEKVRFQKRLKVEKEIEPATLKALVPRFILQPLIENAINHGIAPLKDGGTITIRSKRSGKYLLIEINDTGKGVSSHRKTSSGIGLQLTRERLTRMYRQNQHFQWQSLNNAGFQVTLRIPFRHTRLRTTKN